MSFVSDSGRDSSVYGLGLPERSESKLFSERKPKVKPPEIKGQVQCVVSRKSLMSQIQLANQIVSNNLPKANEKVAGFSHPNRRLFSPELPSQPENLK